MSEQTVGFTKRTEAPRKEGLRGQRGSGVWKVWSTERALKQVLPSFSQSISVAMQIAVLVWQDSSYR